MAPEEKRMNTDCPFCGRIQCGEYEHLYWDLHGDVVRFEPLNPVTPGHMLFVPVQHAEHPDWSAVSRAMGWAAQYGCADDFNLITSSGAAATQTVPHIHIHYVPRREGDGLHLPWTGQKKAA
jgi:diadenosine tetraphosphate (Ap4A) HIT family hydrolase